MSLLGEPDPKTMTTLTLIFVLPLLAAIALAFVPRNFAVIMRAVAVGVTFVTMLLAVFVFWQFNGTTADTNGYNVIAEIPGTDPALKSEVVLLGAHLDSWHSATGATDNADAAASLM